MADFADRSLGIGYVGGSLVLLAILLTVLGLWWFTQGSIAVATVSTPKIEAFYWATILFSNTLGTALGDFFADDSGLGYEGAAVVFAIGLGLVALAYYRFNLSAALAFWAGFILTRPLGATVGDTLTKPFADGGLHLSRITSSAVIAALIAVGVLLSGRRAGSHPARPAGNA